MDENWNIINRKINRIIMKVERFVYYIISQNRLVILNQSKIDDDYRLLLSNDGFDSVYLTNLCKMFCSGFIIGNQNNELSVTNDINEFALY